MDEVIRGMTGPQLTGFVAVVLGAVVGVVVAVSGIIAPQWRQVRQREADAQLKRDLAAAGFSAEDIERVVRATSGGVRPAARVR